jgi:hypothetical protein
VAGPAAAAKKAATRSNAVQLIQARSAEERERVYECRYRVLVEELGEAPDGTDHGRRRVCGPLDEQGVVLAFAGPDGVPIASLRLNPSAAQVLSPELQSALMFERFAGFGAAALSFSSCLAVAPAWRGSPALSVLVGGTYKLCRAYGVRFDFVTANPGTLQAYECLGYRRHAAPFTAEGELRIPLVLLLEDARHLKEIGSPLWRLALAENNPSGTALWFARAFPDAAAFGIQAGMSDEEVWAYVSRRLNQGPLDAVPLLEGLSREDAKRFVASGTTLRCRAGEAVIQAGSSGHEMFVLLSGHVDGCGPNDPLKLLAQLGPGELFGEIAYLSEVRRSASVVARTDVEVLLLTQSYLQRVMAEAPAVAARVLFNLSLILCRRLAGAAGPNGARSVG